MFYLVLIGLGSCLFQAVDLFCWGIAGKKVNIDELAKTSAMTTCLGAGTHIGTQWKVTSYVAWGLCAPHIGCPGATLQHICKLKLLRKGCSVSLWSQCGQENKDREEKIKGCAPSGHQK